MKLHADVGEARREHARPYLPIVTQSIRLQSSVTSVTSSAIPTQAQRTASPPDAQLADLISASGGSLTHLLTSDDAPLSKATLASLLDAHAAGRPKLLAALKELGVAKLADRQALATVLAKLARGEVVAPKKKQEPILDVLASKDLGLNGGGLNVHAASVTDELSAMRARSSTSPAWSTRIISRLRLHAHEFKGQGPGLVNVLWVEAISRFHHRMRDASRGVRARPTVHRTRDR